MSKKLKQSLQCRRCLKSLTYIEVKSSICEHCEQPKRKHFELELFCYATEMENCSTFKAKMVKKLLDKDLCKSCLDKDEKKARKIKRAQRKIGIKQTRRKKKVEWKEKPTKLESNKPLPVFYLKRKKNVIYTKHSPKGRWKKTSVQRLTFLERNYLCRGNPDKVLSVT